MQYSTEVVLRWTSLIKQKEDGIDAFSKLPITLERTNTARSYRCRTHCNIWFLVWHTSRYVERMESILENNLYRYRSKLC